jgi:CheY-like chemotaxis protein
MSTARETNMSRLAMLSFFDHLCNEARNAVHASFGLMDFRPSEGACAWQTCVDATRTSADRLLGIIDDMRELLSEEPPVRPGADAFEFSLCLGETVELLNLALAGRGSRLSFEASAPVTIRQNRSALEQLLMRTLSAAAKLTPQGVVRMSLDAVGSGVRIEIVPPNPELAFRLAKWLDLGLEQIEFRDADEVAWGVPLLVAGRRLRALDGRAEFVCEAGTPPGLALFLPEIPPSADAPCCEDSSALSILVAEDCDESFALIQLLLQRENVERARTGSEAIDLVKEHRFDVVFMDIHMPGMNGYQAIRAIREWETYTSNARTPVVVLSSDDLTTQAHEAAQSGCSGFLRKPLRRGELFDLLNRLKAVRELTC